MTELLVFILSAAGFVALALSMHRHQRDLFNSAMSPARLRLLRTAGWSLLVASILCAASEKSGAAVGLTQWFGAATIAALAVVSGLTYSTSRRRPPSRREP